MPVLGKGWTRKAFGQRIGHILRACAFQQLDVAISIAYDAEKSFSDVMYAGELRAGKRDGEGTHVHSWGGTYTEKWKNDKKHGRGKICDKWGGIRGRLGQRQEGGARREPVEQWAAL